MRIVIATHMFLPFHTAGTEIYTYNLAHALIRRGHQVRVTCVEHLDTGSPDEVAATDDTYDGIPVHRMSFHLYRSANFARYQYDNPYIASHFETFLQEIVPDVVHVTSCVRCSASVMPVVKRLHLPLVFTATDYWFLCPRETLLRDTMQPCQGPEPGRCLRCLYSPRGYPAITRVLVKLPRRLLKCMMFATRWWSRTRFAMQHLGPAFDIERRIPFLIETLRMADVIVAPSQFLAGVFRRHGLDNVRFQRHGIDTSGLGIEKPRLPRNVVRIGYTGHLLPRKGVDVLIRAFKSLPGPLQAHARLMIHGDVDWKTRYVRRLEDLASDEPSIYFAGKYRRAELGNLLQALDVVVVPSIWYENSPLAILEAFAARTPVIASNFGAMAEFVHDGVNGLLFERGDAYGLAQRLGQVIAEPSLLDQLRAGIRPVKTVEQETDELLDLYRSLVRRGT